MAVEIIEINEDEALKPGDVIEMHFRSWSMLWIQAAQVAAIESRLRNKEGYRLIKSRYTNNKIILTFEVIKSNPVVVTAALIAKSVIAIGIVLLIYLSLDRVYKIVESPGGKVAAVGLGGLGIAAAAILLLSILKRQ